MTNKIEKSIDLAAPVDRVWRALTDSQAFGEWFKVKLDGPFAVGEATRGHITNPGYEHLQMVVKSQAIEPQSLFAFTWHPYATDPKVDYDQETPTRVEFRLSSTATGARLVVTETGFDALPSHRRAEAFRMNDGGWTQQVDNIRAYVER